MPKPVRLLLLVTALLTTPGPVLAAPAAPPPRAPEMPVVAAGEKVNINTADVTRLMTLSGVGRRVAERIVEHRKVNGPFRKPEEIRRVDGVGAGLWERNRARIVVE
jgi:competence ComEA-like helix-hairpin-helix protein